MKSFKLSEGDLSARTPPSAIRLDNNDKICALVKVGLALDGVEFECSGGVKDVVKRQVNIGSICLKAILCFVFFIRIMFL